MNSITVKSPGRINIIGEHIDYHNGFVLPAAIDLYTTVKVQINGLQSQVNLYAGDLNEKYTYDINNYHPDINTTWPNYLMGVTSELQKLGSKLSGFDVELSSEVPIGAGLSSSAALECAFAFALNELFQLGFDRQQLINVAQLAEHNFVGIKCGIMDQYASMMGIDNKVILLDCQSVSHEYLDINTGEYTFLLLNSNVSHQLADSEYNFRRNTTKMALEKIKTAYPSVESYRDVNLSHIMSKSANLTDLEIKRCKHILSEIERTNLATLALRNNKLALLGQLMYQSHDSLDKNYDVACKETNFLVALARSNSNILGARQMGGGFGGCTINLIKKTAVHQFINETNQKYHSKFSIRLTSHKVNISHGTHIEQSVY